MLPLYAAQLSIGSGDFVKGRLPPRAIMSRCYRPRLC